MKKIYLISRYFFNASVLLLLAASTLHGQSSGVFSINPDGTGDFATIQDAVDELTANGVSGEVFIRLADGTFEISEIDIPAIPDIREEFRIYFESESGDPQSLHLRGEGRYVFRFDDASFITFRNLLISNEDGHVFLFDGDGGGIHLQNNVIIGRENAASSAEFNLIHSASNISYPGTLIEDNELTGGNWGIRLSSASGEPSQGLSIANNMIHTQRGMHISNFVAPEISANRVLANANFALLFNSNIFDFDDPTLIINNLFVTENQQSANIVTGRNIRFYHNTVVTRGAANNGALRITQNNQQVFVRNNLVAAMGGGRAFVQTTGGANLLGAVQESDHNAYYSPDSHRFTVGTNSLRNLEQWVDLTGQDLNSRFIYPAFSDDDSFETNSFFLDTAGDDVLSVVEEDINGNERSRTPSIGAYEYGSTLTPLSAGNYSVGGAGNYPDMQSAADDLALRGIDGPVTLTLAAGTHTDRAVFFPVPNASVANRVTITSGSGNADDVTILLEDGNDIILDLVSPKYFDIRGLTFNTEQVTGNNTRHGILIRGGFRDVTVTNNRFDAEVISNTTFALSSLASENASGIGLEIRNNEFTGAGYGINLSGMSSGFRSELVRIEQNRLTDSRRGIRVHHATAPHILSNRILNAGNDGIKLNSVRADDDDDEDRPLVANNVVTGRFGGGPVRILLSFDVRFYHNTVLLTGGTETARVLELGSSAGRHDIRNNIFASDSQGPPVQDNSNNTLLDFNNYFSPSPVINRRTSSEVPSLNTHYRTLEEVQDARNYDFNSFYRYVRFTDDQELATNAPWLDDAGADLSQWVPQDINGNARTSSPSIGAHQYSSTLTPVPAGSYTIGNGGDWPDLATAIDELERSGTDGGRIMLEFLPGTYEIEQRIRTIPGTDSVNRLTITSSTGNADDVLIRGIPGTAEYVLLLDGAENINIHNLTFTFEEGEDADRSLIALQFGTGETEISGNTFLGSAREGFDPVQSAVSGVGIYRDRLSISENMFTGSVYATDINTHQLSNPFTIGLELRNNEVTGGEWGFRLRSFLTPQIVNNIVNVQRSAFELFNINSDPDDGLFGLIANNVTRSETNRSMLLQNANRLRIYHNTFDQIRTASSDAMINISGGSDHEFLNNLFRLQQDGRMILANGFQRIDRSDHNNFEFDRDQLTDFARIGATSYNTLQEYEDASGQEVNSTETRVQFVSEETLIPADGQNELLGTPETLTLVPDDLAGVQRDDPPYKGAYEPEGLPDNQPPFFTAIIDEATIAEGDELAFQFEAEDPDGDDLTFSLTEGNGVQNAAITANGLFSFNPDFGQAGEYDFTVRVSDGGLSDEHDFSITVTAVNRPPVFVSEPVTIVQANEAFSYLAEAEDPDGDAVTLTAEILPSWLTFTDNGDGTGLLEGTPLDEDTGNHDVELVASDGDLTATQAFTIEVREEPNQPPVFTETFDEATIAEGDEFAFQFQAEDPDGDHLAFSLTRGNDVDNASITSDGLFTFNPGFGQAGGYDFTVRVSDGGLSDEHDFTITVEETNRPPEILNPFPDITLMEGGAAYQADPDTVFSDPDGDALAFTTESSDESVAVVTVDDLLTVEPVGPGTAVITVTADDGRGGSVSDQFEVTVEPAEEIEPPVAENLEDVTWMNLSVLIDVSEAVSHPQNRSLSVSAAETPTTSGGSAEIVDDFLIRYTPPDGFTGTDNFAYTVSDDLNQKASGDITIEVYAILFELTDLGHLGGGASAATALNDNGMVAGISLNRADQIRPFIWSDGELAEPQISGDGDVQVYAINNSGMLAGFAGVNATEGSAFRYHDGETALVQSDLGSYSAAYAINNSGAIAGVMESGSEYRGFAWDEELIAVSVPEGVLSIVYALSDDNTPAGLVQDANGATRSFRNGETGPDGSRVYGMNRAGLAVGSSNNSPMIWPLDGEPEILEVTGEFYSVNESGWIAGLVSDNHRAKTTSAGFGLRFYERGPHSDLRRQLSRTLDGNSTTAALHVGSSLFHLGELVTNAEGWQLIEAASVNRLGQIAGTARVNGQIRAFLLTPVENDGHRDELAKLFDIPGDDVIYLHQNYPNPFNPSTTIRFILAEQDMVSLAVYDLLGRRVATLIDGPRKKGAHSVEFDGSRLSSGVYVYRLQTGAGVRVRQLTLLK